MGFEGRTEKLRELSHEVTGAYVEVEEESQPLRHFKWIIVVPPRASRDRKKRNQ